MLKMEPVIWLILGILLLGLLAFLMRRRLAQRGLSRMPLPLRLWQAPDTLVWMIILPAALLLLRKHGALDDGAIWIFDLSLNLLVLTLVIYLFQGMMVAREWMARMGFPAWFGSLMVIAGLMLALLPMGQGIAIGFLVLGVLDIWLDFRKLKQRNGGGERSA
jgi:hypothetical protein